MRTCTTCGKEKELDQFSFQNKAKGTRHHICKACHRELANSHYRNNKQQYIDRATRYNKETEARKHYAHYSYAKNKYPSCDCCTVDELKQFAINRPFGYHIDHIIDARDGGKNCLANLQYLTVSEHSRKSQVQGVRARKENKNV